MPKDAKEQEQVKRKKYTGEVESVEAAQDKHSKYRRRVRTNDYEVKHLESPPRVK